MWFRKIRVREGWFLCMIVWMRKSLRIHECIKTLTLWYPTVNISWKMMVNDSNCNRHEYSIKAVDVPRIHLMSYGSPLNHFEDISKIELWIYKLQLIEKVQYNLEYIAGFLLFFLTYSFLFVRLLEYIFDTIIFGTSWHLL